MIMKQHITIDQWRELSKEQQNYLIEWYIKREHDDLSTIPFFTIGEMIEFLKDKTGECNIHSWTMVDSQEKNIWTITSHCQKAEELCDALWEVIKRVLENLNLPNGKMESKYVFMAERINNGVYQYCLCERYLKENEIIKIPDYKWQNESGSKSKALLKVFVE